MIRLEDLSKTFTLNGRHRVVADRINITFPTGSSVALLGRNGAGKSSLLKMISGAMLPSSGRILSTGTISWPVGYAGSFSGEMTGEQNCRFVARIYGVDTDELIAFVRDFAELGQHFHLPVRTYSSGMKSRLAFGLSMAVPFDTYLVDEVSAVGDAAFKAKSNHVFRTRLKAAGAVVVSHSMSLLRAICDSGAVLERGKLIWFEDVEDAIALHLENMRLPRPD